MELKFVEIVHLQNVDLHLPIPLLLVQATLPLSKVQLEDVLEQKTEDVIGNELNVHLVDHFVQSIVNLVMFVM